MDDIEGLRRQYDRLGAFPDFRPGDSIWWIYLRAEVEKVVVRHDLPERLCQSKCIELTESAR